MKITHFLTIAFVLLGFIRTFAQAEALAADKWQRIETANKELSFAVPKDYLVHIQPGANGDRTAIFGFQNGVSFEIRFQNQANAAGNLGRINVESAKNPTVLDYKFNDFYGKSVIYSQPAYENKIFLASKNAYYVLRISAESKEKAEIPFFLQSLRLRGAALFEGKSNAAAIETVPAKTLKTSAAVSEALKRKSEKIERAVTIEPLAAFREENPDLALIPAVVLTDIQPDPGAFPRDVEKSGEIKVRVKLLANGQVGDIAIYSDIDKSVLRSYVNSAKNLKFIPAKKSDGGAVDSTRTLWSAFGVTVTTQIINVK